MAILPVYTTSKLHAARINLRQTRSSTPGVLVNCVKGVVCKNFRGRASTPNLMNPPFYEILDPPLLTIDNPQNICEQVTTKNMMLLWWFSPTGYYFCKIMVQDNACSLMYMPVWPLSKMLLYPQDQLFWKASLVPRPLPDFISQPWRKNRIHHFRSVT